MVSPGHLLGGPDRRDGTAARSALLEAERRDDQMIAQNAMEMESGEEPSGVFPARLATALPYQLAASLKVRGADSGLYNRLEQCWRVPVSGTALWHVWAGVLGVWT